jgi:hypothetical protein
LMRRTLKGFPQELFVTHFLTALEQWNADGDQITLLMDANEDIRAFGNTIVPSGLRKVLLERHGPYAPATYHGGSQPIDGVFASPSIHIAQGGYLEFGYSPHTDHRGLWIDVHYQIAFGHIMPPIPSHQAH